MPAMESDIRVRTLDSSDSQWALDIWKKMWKTDHVVTLGKLYYFRDLHGFIAECNSQRVGLLTYDVRNKELEIITLDSIMENVGIGTALIERALEEARKRKCERVLLITTNDNTDALRFYQRKGFSIHSINVGAIEESRKLKPSIPHVGNDGIPIRDEILLEYIIGNKE